MQTKKIKAGEIVGRTILSIVFLFLGIIAISGSGEKSYAFQMPAGIVFLIGGIFSVFALIQDIMKRRKVLKGRQPNLLIIQRPSFMAGSETNIEIYIDKVFCFSLGNESENILKIENGKHIIKAIWSDAQNEREFEINNDSKLFVLQAGRPPKIKEM